MGKHRFQSMQNLLDTNLETPDRISLSSEMQNSLDKLENSAIENSDLERFLSSLSDSWIDKFSNQIFNLGDNLYSYPSSLDQDIETSEGGLWLIRQGGVRLVVYDDARSRQVSLTHLTVGMSFVPIHDLVQHNKQGSSIGDSVQIYSAFSNYQFVASRDTVLAYLDSESLQLLLQQSDQLAEFFLLQWQSWKSQLEIKQSNHNQTLILQDLTSSESLDGIQSDAIKSDSIQNSDRMKLLNLAPNSSRSRFKPIQSRLKVDPNQSRSKSVSKSVPAISTSPVSNVVEFPTARRKRRSPWQSTPFIEQQSVSDCGPTCLAMISQYWGQRYALPHLRELCHVGRSGAQLQHLAKAAEALGFQARPVRASWSYLGELRSPWIAHWDGEHYVVVYPSRGRKVIVADPAGSRQKISIVEFQRHWTGYALLLEPTAEFYNQRPEKAQSLSRFGALLGRESTVLIQIITITLLAQVFGLVAPMFTQIILDQVVVQKSLSALHVFAIGALIFGVWRVGLMAVRQYLLDYFANRLDLTLITAFMRHTLRLPLKFFEDRHVGDILTRIQENSKIQQFLVRQAVSVWLDAAMAFVYIGLMLYYNAQLAFLVIAMIPPFAILTLIATPFMKRVSRSMFKANAEETSLAVEMMSGIATLKSTASEQDLRWRWEEKLVAMLNQRFKYQKLSNNVGFAGGMIQTIASTALLWYGAFLVIQGQLTIGQFVAFNMLIGNVISPMLGVIGVWDEFQEVLIAIERLNDVFMATPEDVRVPKTKLGTGLGTAAGTPSENESALVPLAQMAMPRVMGEVRFDRVVFAYDGLEEDPTISNLSFTVQPGQTVAIVGRSGSGKSTLVKLLQGLYLPTKGRILVDGYSTDQVSPQSLRSQLGVVPQDCFLFSGTVAENIQLYRLDYTVDHIIGAAKLAEAHSFIQELPLGYQTKVGERGANLSGGQRQRVAIARALLGNPALLILDEATSALDTESERRFQQNLERISRDCTTFIIAHRLSTVQRADLILVLDRGLLVEQGNHSELMEKRGLYFHLAQQQLAV